MANDTSSPNDTGEELQFDYLMRAGPEASATAPVICECKYRDVPVAIGKTPGCAVRVAEASGIHTSCWNREGTTATCSTSQGWRKSGLFLFQKSMATITTADFRQGSVIEFKGEPHTIVEFQHVNPGKGSAFVRTRLKSLKTGKVQDFTYKSGETVVEIPVETNEMQYLYKEGENYVFMNNFSYEQISIPQTVLSDYLPYMKPNDTYQILVHDDEALGVRFPKKVRLLVTEASEGARGDTVAGAGKVVKVETGLKVTVPLFIKQGDTIAVDTETGQYLERA